MSLFQVSVVIPVFNAGKFIKKAVDSALAEEEVEEIIIIDDASTDNSFEICQQLASENSKIKLYQHDDKKNHGAPTSMNLGIIKATCEYIAILGADDFFLPNRFKKDKEILLSDPAVDGVYSAISPFPLDENGEGRLIQTPDMLMTMKRVVPPDELFEYMSPIGYEGFFSLDGLTVRRRVYDKIGLLDPYLLLSQDTHISIKMAAVCILVSGFLDKPVAMFGLHINNRSRYKDRITATRPYLFYDLYKWGRKNNLKKSRIFLLWQRYYEFYKIVYKPSRKQQFWLLTKEFSKNPLIIFSRFYIKQLPILSRILP